MATKLQPLISSPTSHRRNFSTQYDQNHRIHCPWPELGPRTSKTQRRSHVVRLSLSNLHDALSLSENLNHDPQSLFELADTAAGYSVASYYTSLGLFVISVPGLWSLIKRSVKSKVVQKTYIGEGEGKKVPNQVAGEILSFFTRNNFAVTDRGETVT